MKKWIDNISCVVITFWVGDLWITALWAGVMFKTLEDPTLAGSIAGEFFSIMTYIGLVSGCTLLTLRFLRNGFGVFKQLYFWTIVAMLSMVILEKYGVHPQIEAVKAAAAPQAVELSPYADSFKIWHAVARVVYLVQCVLGLTAVTVRLTDAPKKD